MRGSASSLKNIEIMKPRHIFLLSLPGILGLVLVSCSEDLDSPVLPEAGSIAVPEALPLDAEQLFGVWEATTSYGDNNQNYHGRGMSSGHAPPSYFLSGE